MQRTTFPPSLLPPQSPSVGTHGKIWKNANIWNVPSCKCVKLTTISRGIIKQNLFMQNKLSILQNTYSTEPSEGNTFSKDTKASRSLARSKIWFCHECSHQTACWMRNFVFLFEKCSLLASADQVSLSFSLHEWKTAFYSSLCFEFRVLTRGWIKVAAMDNNFCSNWNINSVTICGKIVE